MPKSFLGQTLLSQYTVDEFITHTPLGEMYRATDLRSNQPLALTFLPKSISEDPEILIELESASKSLRAISHPNLTPYLGVYQTPTSAFVLEDWIDGPSLKKILDKAPVSVKESLIYAKAICSGLEVLHQHQYLHLNLAPELIRISKQGGISLGGMAFSQPVGKKNVSWLRKFPRTCFAPEQFSARPLSPAADIYALATLLYMLNTGRWINGKAAPSSNEAVRRVHLEATPPAPISLNSDIPDHFSRMLLWALRKKPEDRLKTTIELFSSLALAAKIPVDEIPPLIDAENAPVTSTILSDWTFLPPSKLPLISQNNISLEDRLAILSVPPARKSNRRGGWIPILLFLLVAGFISLFWIVHPADNQISTPVSYSPYAANFTPPPTLTALPVPTDPNGGRIAFTCTRGDFNQLCMINRDGTGLSQLTDMDASNYYPAFTPDGSSLLFSSNRNGSFDLYLLLFGQKQLFQITKSVGNVVSPDYSPDGRYIVFANRAGDGPASIWMVNADGLNAHLVYAGSGTIVATAWSPDGEKIAYAMSVGIPQEYEIFTMDTQGKNHVRVSQRLKGIGGSIDWSPDGRSLLIYAGPFGDKDIFKLDIASGDATQVTNGGNNAGASYSPDGLYIVFNSLRNKDQADLYIMRSNGENQVQLTNDPQPDWGPQWVR
jgi:Tol biopolymer transport system component